MRAAARHQCRSHGLRRTERALPKDDFKFGPHRTRASNDVVAGAISERLRDERRQVQFEVNGDPTTHVSEFFDGIDHDYDIGVVQL